MGALPNFFIIGAPKCGTTTLWKQLKAHPRVFMSTPKEPHYFAGLCRGDEEMTWQEYRSLFDRVDGENIVGEASNSNFILPEAAKHIRERIGPEVKLLAILRSPVERAFSHYLHFVRAGAESLSFEEAIQKEEQRLRNGKPATYAYRDIGMYGRRLEPYYDRFGSESIKVVLFEDFVQHPVEVMHRICLFLGIDGHSWTDEAPSENSRPAAESTPAQAADWLLAQWYQWAPHEGRVFKRVDRYIVRNHQSSLSPRPEIRRQMLQEYAEDLDRLSELAGVDTTQWRSFSSDR